MAEDERSTEQWLHSNQSKQVSLHSFFHQLPLPPCSPRVPIAPLIATFALLVVATTLLLLLLPPGLVQNPSGTNSALDVAAIFSPLVPGNHDTTTNGTLSGLQQESSQNVSAALQPEPSPNLTPPMPPHDDNSTASAAAPAAPAEAFSSVPPTIRLPPPAPLPSTAASFSSPPPSSSLPFNLSDYFAAFSRNSHFLVYTQGGDRCVGPSHFSWSVLCALAEAKLLRRTFVYDTRLCFVNWNRLINRDMGLYINLRKIKNTIGLLPLQHFWQAVEEYKRQVPSAASGISVLRVDKKALSSQLQQHSGVAIIVRDLGSQEPAYEVCKLPENKELLQRDYSLWSQRSELIEIANKIASNMSWDFDALHIRRGDKAAQKKRWPHLDNDTRPEALLEKLPRLITPGRTVYISTDERSPGFFKPLERLYRLRTLTDFERLWAPGSSWHSVYEQEMKPVLEFDQYMQTIVDYKVLSYGKKKVETFNDLTSDPRNGIS